MLKEDAERRCDSLNVAVAQVYAKARSGATGPGSPSAPPQPLICGYLLRSLLPFLTCIYKTLLDLEIMDLEIKINF